MTDFRNMYLTMMQAAEDVIRALDGAPFPEPEISFRDEVIAILTKAQQEAETIYIDTVEDCDGIE